MSAHLTLGAPEHLDKLVALVTAFHAEAGIEMSDEQRRRGLAPLLDGIPHGAAYLIGPPRAPIGYVVICFGWSVEFGGLDAIIDEIYVRPAVRGRGIATEAVPEEELDGLVTERVEMLLSRPTRAVGEAKRLLLRSSHRSLEETLTAEARAQDRMVETDDFSEGVMAFMEGRDPEFTGE